VLLRSGLNWVIGWKRNRRLMGRAVPRTPWLRTHKDGCADSEVIVGAKPALTLAVPLVSPQRPHFLGKARPLASEDAVMLAMSVYPRLRASPKSWHHQLHGIIDHQLQQGACLAGGGGTSGEEPGTARVGGCLPRQQHLRPRSGPYSLSGVAGAAAHASAIPLLRLPDSVNHFLNTFFDF
jgi:hypothetical protein